jgi:hypothetical protein
MAYSTAQIDSFRNKLTSLKSTRTKLLTNRMSVKTVIDGDVVQHHLYDIPFLTSRINELEAILLPIDNPSEYVTSIRISSSGKGL